jgi:hypothetical protein
MKVSTQRSARRLLTNQVRLVSHGHHEPAGTLTPPRGHRAVLPS